MADVKVRGTNGLIFYGNNAANKIPGVTNYELTVDTTDEDCSDHDSSGWGERITGTSTWSVDVSGWWLQDGNNNAVNTSQAAMQDAAISGDIQTVEMRFAGTGSGKAKHTGSARVKGFKISAPQSGAIPFSFTFVGSGALSRNNQS